MISTLGSWNGEDTGALQWLEMLLLPAQMVKLEKSQKALRSKPRHDRNVTPCLPFSSNLRTDNCLTPDPGQSMVKGNFTETV